MADKERLYIFHLHTQDGKPLILHPFKKPEKLEPQLETFEVEGRFGKEPRVEVLTMFRNQLYNRIDESIRKWLSDVRFIPKFLISSGVFFVVLFATSYIIHDPLPVVDEFLLGLGGAIATYLAIGKRDMGSEAAMKKRVTLRTAIDRIKFEESPFLERVEESLHYYESAKPEQALREMIEPVTESLNDADRREAVQFVRLLEERFDFKKLKKDEKFLRTFFDSEATDQDNSIRRWVEARKLNVPLYALYRRFKNTVEKVK